LFLTTINFENTGKQAIESKDISENRPIVFTIIGADEIIALKNIRYSDKDIKHHESYQNNNITISFDFLNPKDKGTMEIMHKGKPQRVEVQARIKNMQGQIQDVSSDKDSIKKTNNPVMETILLGILYIGICFVSILNIRLFFSPSWIYDIPIGIIGSSLLLLGLGYFLHHRSIKQSVKRQFIISRILYMTNYILGPLIILFILIMDAINGGIKSVIYSLGGMCAGILTGLLVGIITNRSYHKNKIY